MKRSIEVEYWVIDESGNLTSPGCLTEATPGAEQEFVEPLLEIKTAPCATTEALREQLYKRIDAVLTRGRDVGKRLVPLATPLSEQPISQLPSKRTQIQEQAVGSNFQYVRRCAGTHIHVEQLEGHTIEQANVLTALDPALALVHSSPYDRCQYLGIGARSRLYRWQAYEHLPLQGRLWPYIRSIDDWHNRLQTAYEEFVIAAVRAGIPPDTVRETFNPDSAVWVPVKIREEFPTVEWRSPDTALPSEVLRLAEEVIAVVEHIKDTPTTITGSHGQVSSKEIILPEFDALEGYVRTAITDGKTSQQVSEYLSRMGLSVQEYQPLVETFEVGPITPADARRIRLEYAAKLERDMEHRSVPGIG